MLSLTYWAAAISAAVALSYSGGASADAQHPFQDCELCPLMVPVPAGSFRMGSPQRELSRSEDEGPMRDVTISKRFAVAAFEITVEQWRVCFETGGCTYQPGAVGAGYKKDPVLHVSWHDAQQFVGWLAAETGKPYRLLTEAEWEYAARAGTTTPFHTGDVLTGRDANFDKALPYPPALDPAPLDPFRRRWAKPVGQYQPNAFGLFDIHGNASEWVQDCYDPKAYVSFQSYPSANETDAPTCKRVVRGGASHNSGAYGRSANRHAFPAEARTIDVGVRVGLTLAE